MGMVCAYAVIVICTAIYAIKVLQGGMQGRNELLKYALIPMQVKRGQKYRLLTSGFIHFEMMHIMMNMYSLYNLGVMEYILGHFRFMAVLLASIVGGGLMCTYFGRQDTATIGISGGLYGLLASYIVWLFKTGLLWQASVRYSIIRIVIINLLINLMPGISRQGHAGGFLTGLLLSFFML